MFLISIGSVYSVQPVINLPLKICKIGAKKKKRRKKKRRKFGRVYFTVATNAGLQNNVVYFVHFHDFFVFVYFAFHTVQSLLFFCGFM